MQTTSGFLDQMKGRLKLRSDAALTGPLGVTKMAISKLRNQQMFFSEKLIAKVAAILELDPDYVRQCVALEREQMRVVRAKDRLAKLEKNLAKKLAAGIGALLVAGGLGALLGLAPQPSRAAEFDISTFPAQETSARPAIDLHIMRKAAQAARRLARRALERLAAFARTLGSTPGAALGAA